MKQRFLVALSILFSLPPALISAQAAEKPPQAAPMLERIGVAPLEGGFAMKDYWVWCGSVIRGEDARYHMFASRWPKRVPFSPNWLTNSEIVRAVSDTPEGPYEFAEVVLPARDHRHWDGQMTHNPTIHKAGDTYLLFYTGSTYDFERPGGMEKLTQAQKKEAHDNQRIGLATATSLSGPWQRLDQPILQPRPGKWDRCITTNPAPCVRDDGSVLLVYKSKLALGQTLKLGVAFAKTHEGPYERLSDEPIFTFGQEKNKGVEDAYIWWNGDHYQAIMKDMTGAICGEHHGGIHGWSRDGVDWHVFGPPKAYSKTVRWADGTTTKQGQFERPQLLIQDGVPTHLFGATGDGPGGFHRMTKTWNMVVPLNGGK